jgi:hypothetical protein
MTQGIGTTKIKSGKSKNMNETVIQKITDLTDKLYELIGRDHHKDRDCHYFIETKWSYGRPPVYVIVHNGYIFDDISEEWASYELACIRLKELLERHVKYLMELDTEQ